MKIAPIVKAIEGRCQEEIGKDSDLKVKIIHTGQHYDQNMSEVFFNDLGIPEPSYNLEVGSGSHAEQTARIMIEYEKVVLKDKPDLVLVVGDVNSTIACSLTAKKMRIPVGHVEAGLRSFDEEMPEEINRKLTDAISDLLFVTEESGLMNLRNEGIEDGKVHFVGNVMIDTLLDRLKKIDEGGFTPNYEIEQFCLENDQFAVLTLHRPSNVDEKENLKGIWGALSEIAGKIPILFPIHPRTKVRLGEFGMPNIPSMHIIEPIGYMDMLYAVKGSSLVLTDSGGLQEETTVLGIPCVTIRENTERPSTIELGTNYLAGTNPDKILSIANDILEGRGKKGQVPPLWDGKAAERIAEVIVNSLKFEVDTSRFDV
jgi:UDP-N-acetylglucosamine 2-epimerase (non-hydrolysing)